MWIQKLRSALRDWVNELVSGIALLVATISVFIALVQLADTKRALALNSLETIKEGYSTPKMRFFDSVWRYLRIQEKLEGTGDRKNSDEVNYMELAYYEFELELYASEYLRSIEFVCNAYIEELLEDEAEKFALTYIKSDIEHLLLLFYNEEDGGIEFGEDLSIGWIKSDDENAFGSELGGYPQTLECVKLWEIDLKQKSIF